MDSVEVQGNFPRDEKKDALLKSLDRLELKYEVALQEWQHILVSPSFVHPLYQVIRMLVFGGYWGAGHLFSAVIKVPISLVQLNGRSLALVSVLPDVFLVVLL